MESPIGIKIAFSLAGLLAVLVWRVALFSEKPKLSFLEIARAVVLAYGLFFLSALPLVWADHWSLESQTLLLAALAVLATPFAWGKRQILFSWENKLSWPIALGALSILGLGIATQWKPIYYLYANNDPSAYLTSAQHIARTGSFFHKDPLVAQAYGGGEKSLKPLLNLEEAPEEWRLTRNYGVTVVTPEKGEGVYHGFFGASLFLAAGVKLFGEANCLRMHWFHLVATCLLILAVLEILLEGNSFWGLFAILIYVLCPLVAPLFREPISEPLAGILFLSFLLGSLQLNREPVGGRAVMILALMGALCTRVSAFMYLPFWAVTCLWIDSENLSQKANRRFWLAAISGTFFAIATALRLAPSYASDIFLFYSEKLLHRSLSVEHIPWVPLVIVMAVPVILVFALRAWFRKVLKNIFSSSLWSWGWRAFYLLLALGIIARYVRLMTKLTTNIGGVPFVLFNLDSLLFYGCPVVVVIGLAYWFTRLSEKPKSELIFFQGFLPFCAFFYAVFRFMPLNTQVNFQRYLLIELIPLAVIGTAVVLQRCRTSWQKAAVYGVATFALVWNGGITYAINRFDVCQTAYSTYAEVRRQIATLAPVKPVVVAVSPSWLEQVYLMPLSNGFDIPVLFINDPFSFEASQGIAALQRLGYHPLLASSRAGERIEEGSRAWRSAYLWNDCHRYSKFGLGAPPLELAENCISLSFFSPTVKSLNPPAPEGPAWRTSWRQDSLPFPISISHWYGFEINGPRWCKEHRIVGPQEASVSMIFEPELDFHLPRVLLNGEPAGRGLTAALQGKHRLGHRVDWKIKEASMDCNDWNTVDIFLSDKPSFQSVRRAQIISVSVETDAGAWSSLLN